MSHTRKEVFDNMCYRKQCARGLNQCITSKFGEFISPAEVAVVYLKFILNFIKFCSLTTELWLIRGF